MLNFAVVGIGPVEIIIVLAILLLLFGAKRLPELGRSLGTGMREFKSSVTGKDREENEQRALEPSDHKADAESSAPAAKGSDRAAEERASAAGPTHT